MMNEEAASSSRPIHHSLELLVGGQSLFNLRGPAIYNSTSRVRCSASRPSLGVSLIMSLSALVFTDTNDTLP